MRNDVIRQFSNMLNFEFNRIARLQKTAHFQTAAAQVRA
jgi:uncharacterized protein YehS (DUF1456 family)